MNPVALIGIALGVVALVIGWRGSFDGVYQMLTGHTRPASSAPALLPKLGDVAMAQPSAASAAQAAQGVPGSATSYGTKLGIPDLRKLIADAGGSYSAQIIGAAIAMAESGGDPGSVGDQNNPRPGATSRGLWQINSVYHNEVPDACAFNPSCAAKEFLRISNNGTNFGPWSTYTNGSYRRYMDPTHGPQP